MEKKEFLIIFVLAVLVTGLTWPWEWIADMEMGGCRSHGLPGPYYSKCSYAGRIETKIVWEGLIVDLLFWFLVLVVGWWVVKRLKSGKIKTEVS